MWRKEVCAADALSIRHIFDKSCWILQEMLKTLIRTVSIVFKQLSSRVLPELIDAAKHLHMNFIDLGRRLFVVSTLGVYRRSETPPYELHRSRESCWQNITWMWNVLDRATQSRSTRTIWPNHVHVQRWSD